MWIPAIIAAVVAVVGVTDWHLHGMFGSEDNFSGGGALLEEPRNLHPKHLRYEIFGQVNKTVNINYMDENANAQNARVSTLPWSLEFTMNPLTSVLNLVAQTDGGYVGCRITVNDEVKDEYIARLPYAQTYCEVRSA